ncbi:Aldehyde dehydrogenase [Alteracholeplasma palmae J233]|uniref:Aldehyde dehydrogenase n=1 Tax=Alteracholeplasma palmae (strain ATCC 49389 / J233) TaxID=1318466 RepID=U4KPG3_ALTPJ|nr:aldehyde dehydrogenase family protein [Alteracholeplasma palmae]CCV64130.1 Aldehyde dehydrogenase [Alteracholeplasma palmae J233]
MSEYHIRITQIKKLRKIILEKELDIKEALYKDLGKSYEESYMTEIGPVLSEISITLRKLKKWMKPKKVRTSLLTFPSKAYEIPEKYGKVLIIGPWNYPFQLIFSPLVGAISAGNDVVVKPSEYSVYTQNIIVEIIKEVFETNKVDVKTGDYKVSEELLNQRFDYIFFTGSEKVGKIVMQKAANYLTPVTLELGGKSPAIIDNVKNMELAARRIAFGKLINAGQTCIAPDYLLIKEEDKAQFIHYYKIAVEQFYGKEPLKAIHYPKIINTQHHNRLTQLMEGETILFGGNSNESKISPTILEITEDSPIMKEEIFGPILPIMTYNNLNEAISYINKNEKPLALYMFSDIKKNIDEVVNNTSFGGATINDTLMHFTNENLGFGGVGYSGMGKYHGKHSFDTFSHYKPVLVRKNWLDIKLRYLPIKRKAEKTIKTILK